MVNTLLFRAYTRWKLLKPEIRFSVELTTKCNARCKMCTRQRLVDSGFLSVGDMNELVLKKVIDEMVKFKKAGYSVVFVPMGLGEPLMYRKLFPLFKKIKSKGIKTVLVTNGLILNENSTGELLKSGIDEISISLNSINKNSYEKMNGVDGFDVVVENIKKLLKRRDKGGLFLPRVYIQYLGEDYKSFDEEISKWNKLMRNDDKCYVHKIVNQAGLANNKKGVLNHPCSQPLFRVAVKINGDIYPCDPALYSGNNKLKQLFLGNVNKTSIFNDFMDKKSKRYKIIEKMKKCDYSDLKCCKVCTTKNLSGSCFFEMGVIKPYGYQWL